MKTQSENAVIATQNIGSISMQRVKEIMKEEEIEYTDEELMEVLHFVCKMVSIASSHFERTKLKETKVININTITTHETKSLPLHQSQYRRAS